LQRLLYASNGYSVLLIFQAMDAAGKDGADQPRPVWRQPAGLRSLQFKHPSADELEHDFLWRTTCRLPAARTDRRLQPLLLREVLIVRVHSEILRSEGFQTSEPAKRRLAGTIPFHRGFWRTPPPQRHPGHQIFLHLSKEEQRKRFLERIDEPDKNWNSARPTSPSGNSGINT